MARARDPRATLDHLGAIPEFLAAFDPRPAAEQITEQYCGGWMPFKGFCEIDGGRYLKYPGDPPMSLLWEVKLREETVRVYESAWVSITQPDGAVDYARLD